MAQDAKFINKLDILSQICHFKCYLSMSLKMWRMGITGLATPVSMYTMSPLSGHSLTGRLLSGQNFGPR